MNVKEAQKYYKLVLNIPRAIQFVTPSVTMLKAEK